MRTSQHRPGRRLGVLTLAVTLLIGVLSVSTATAAAAAPPAATAAPAGLTVGQLPAPVDVENLTAPLLGWQLAGGTQTAYQVQMATSADLATADVWDSGKTSSGKNANIAYAGPALTASSGYYWRVRTWNAQDVASDWSAVSHFGTGPGSTWSDASPIWTPGLASGWIDYTYEGTFSIAGVAASVNFRAKDASNFYMWQFRASDASPDPSTLKIHANVNGSYTVLSVNQLPFALAKNTDYNYRIVVDGSNVSTYLRATGDSDWTFVNSTDDASFTSGGIGFRTGSTESAYYDNLKVTDPTGKVLYANDFSAASTDFTCGTVTGGRLFIGTGKNCNYGVDWQNYTTQVTLKIGTNTAAVSLKGTDSNNFYLWQLKAGNPGTIQINKNVGGTFSTIKTISLGRPITAGTDYVLKVEALGNTYKTSLDGALVDTLTDATYSVGRVGFRTGGSEAFTASNLTVTTPDGTVFYSNAFPSGNTDFTCGTATGGGLTVPNNANCLVTTPSTKWAFLRGEVNLDAAKTVRWAHLYAAGASTNGARAFVYKMWVNGTFVGIGPTRPIGSETRYDGYDVTSLIRGGAANAIGVLANTASDQRFIGKLVVTYTDGSTQSFGTGSSWSALNGSTVLPEGGSIGTSYYSAPKENFNAAAYPFGFDQPGFDASAWRTPVVKPAFASLVATPTAKVERQLREPASVVEYSPGNYFIDYGRTWVGGLSLDVTGTAGQVLDIRYGEVTSAANTVKCCPTSGGNNYQDKWTLKAGTQHLETWGMRVFRYAQVLGAPTGLSKGDFKAMAYVYPYDESAGVFDSADENLNKVWQLNKNTIEATNGNLYVDSWERERGAYEADSYLQMMSNFYTSSDPTLGNYSIAYLFKQRTWPTEWPIYIILAMHDSYQQTGDIEALNTYYTALQGKLPDKWFESSTGLIRKTSGSSGAGSCTDCDIVDWPTSERDGYKFTQYNTVINAISYRAYLDMVDIATSLGKTADAATYQAKADAIKAAVNAKMWDASKGAYRDGLNTDQSPVDHWAVQASVFANAFGLTDDAKAASVAAYIGTRGMVCSVYCSAFLFESLYNGDRADIAYDLLTSTGKRSYLNMINAGAGATMEAWDLSLKGNTTYSHPWAASIAYNIPQGMFGIRPTTAGYDTFDVKPQPDSVAWANVTVPTLKGRIGAAYDTVAPGSYDVGVYVPGNAKARVYVPGGSDGESSVYVDGVSTTATLEGGYLRVDNVTPGCHVFSENAGLAAGANSKLTGVCPGGYQATQSITFDALTGKTFGDADFAVSATASSGLPVAFTAAGACTVSGSTVHLTGAGQCSVTASQLGNDNVSAAADVVQSFTVAQAGQSISFGPLPARTVGDADFAVSATASSGLPVTFTAAGVCTVSGSTVHLTGAGQCSVTASQPGNDNVAAAADVTQSFTVSPAAPAVTAPGAPTGLTTGLGDAAVKVTWVAPASTGGAAITRYTVTSAPGGKTCTTTGALSCTVTGLTNGKAYTFTVTATNSAGTSAPSTATAPVTPTYAPGTAGNVSVSVSAKAQCVSNKPSLAVYVLNKEATPVNLVVTTAFGTKTVTGLAAGAATYQTLNATGSTIAAGTATIAVTKTVNGNPVTTTYEAGYQPVTCG